MKKMLKIIAMLFVIATVVFVTAPVEEVTEPTKTSASPVHEEAPDEEEATVPVEEVTEEELQSSLRAEFIEQKFLDDFLKEFEEEGKIEFNTPKKMKVGESKIFSAYITRNISENISEVIESNETLQSRNISVTPEMKVTLIGSGEGTFIIDPLTDDVQPIIGQRITTWKWSVTPQKSGKQTLMLNVYLVITSDSGETIRYINELENEIEVGVNPSIFVENNWQWLIGTIVTILLALLGMYAKNKSK